MNVYLIQVGETGPVKIGIAKNVDLRLSQMQVSSPQPLCLRASFEGGALEEWRLHQHFAKQLIRGGWYENSVLEQLAEIKRIAASVTDEQADSVKEAALSAQAARRALGPYRQRLHKRALAQYGYVTSRDASELGIPAVELRKLCQRGGLERLAQGLYRFESIPCTDRDQFMEAVLQAGPDARLVGSAVLSLHELALVNPRRILVASPHRTRRRLAPFIQHEQRRAVELPDAALTAYSGIPSMTVAHALRECRGQFMLERLLEGARAAEHAGLLARGELELLLPELELAEVEQR